MELQVGGINDNHVGDVGEGQMVKGRHVEELSCVPDNGFRAWGEIVQWGIISYLDDQ